ncbi:TF-AP-2 domain-containing protein [Aphelenchoides besseyi]|nr:TF-AP-2 domain-containing protein [Aphelenchoides besseyi]
MYANEEHHSNDSRNSYYSHSDNRKRAHDSSIDDEDVTPKRKVPTANGAFNMCNPHMYNAFQPNAQSTPQNLGCNNYTYPNQWHNHTYPPYQPQLSTQHLANNSLPTSNYPMSSVPMQPTSFLAQNNTFESGIYTDSSSSSTLNTSSNTARDEVFMKVPGRLALLNNNSKLDITVSEVKRRTGAPENLNISLLGAFLRKAKNKGSNKQLNDELEEKGIEISKNRRVTLKQGAFTGLCEQEAMKLAEDFQGALSDHLATKTFTKEVKKVCCGQIVSATHSISPVDRQRHTIQN